MAAYYLDASAVVKEYVFEPGSPVVGEILDTEALHDIHMSDIGGVEVAAGLARRGRGRNSLSEPFQAAIREFQHDFDTRWLIVGTTTDLLHEARTLAIRHFLRGYDAVHLAAALEADRLATVAGERGLTSVSADTALNAAAEAEGLRVLDPTRTRPG
ncbi:VapC toxin family PIN domain ribonuclease [Candidatus Poribacteria bacterium]|nr:VapC toxin family PIN domain ribonuclease [Candidatus Poribacteria bacterium]